MNELEELKKENLVLRKALESRESTFNKQLEKRVNEKFYDLSFIIGEAIASVADRDLVNQLKNKVFHLEYSHSTYGKSGYFIRFQKKEEEKELKLFMEEMELKKFQESVDAFSWVVSRNGLNE